MKPQYRCPVTAVIVSKLGQNVRVMNRYLTKKGGTAEAKAFRPLTGWKAFFIVKSYELRIISGQNQLRVTGHESLKHNTSFITIKIVF